MNKNKDGFDLDQIKYDIETESNQNKILNINLEKPIRKSRISSVKGELIKQSTITINKKENRHGDINRWIRIS